MRPRTKKCERKGRREKERKITRCLRRRDRESTNEGGGKKGGEDSEDKRWGGGANGQRSCA